MSPQCRQGWSPVPHTCCWAGAAEEPREPCLPELPPLPVPAAGTRLGMLSPAPILTGTVPEDTWPKPQQFQGQGGALGVTLCVPLQLPQPTCSARKGPDTGIAWKTEVLHYFSLSKQLLTWGETLKCTPRAKGKGNQVPQAELCLDFSAPSTFGLSPEEIIVQFSELFSLQAWLKLITQLSLSCLSPAAPREQQGQVELQL